MRGDGIAKLMWEHLCELSCFFWRAHRENHFPLGICVAQRIGASKGRCVFWHGLNQDEAEVATEYAVHRPIDFDS